MRISRECLLEPLALTDLPALGRLMLPNHVRLSRWLPWMEGMVNMDEVRRFLEFALRAAEEGRGIQCGIWRGKQIVGVVGLHSIDRLNRVTSLGYWLGEEGEEQGLARRATALLVAHAFTRLDLNRVEIRCATENVRSRRVPETLGFRTEGVLREAEWLHDRFVDHVVYALLRREWGSASVTGG
jgi:ribosomal-protein-serine acetyltransferase